jgi:hypothetical protein
VCTNASGRPATRPQCSGGTALASAAGTPPGRRHVDKVYHQVMSRLPFVWDYDIDEPTFRADAQDAGLAEQALAGDGFQRPLRFCFQPRLKRGVRA